MFLRAVAAAALLGVPGCLGISAVLAAGPAPIAERLETANAQRGERVVSKQCAAACHTYERGAGPRVGPNLWDIVGKPMAAKDGYRYSRAMRARAEEDGVWTYEVLDAYLASPRKIVPGTSMTFVGLSKPQERADVILYLRSLSADPYPLPERP